MDLLEKQAKKAIAIESRELKELEQEGVIEFNGSDLLINLSLSTQGAFADLPLDYQDSLNLSLVAFSSGSDVPVSGGS